VGLRVPPLMEYCAVVERRIIRHIPAAVLAVHTRNVEILPFLGFHNSRRFVAPPPASRRVN